MKGFTLFELLLAIFISSILLLSSVMIYRHFTLQNQLALTVNRIVSALHYARIQAISEKIPVVLCPNENNVKCGSDWQTGLLVTDLNNQTIFRAIASFAKLFRVVWRGSLGDNDLIQFQRDGFTYGQQGSFLICGPPRSHLSAKIIVLRTGRVRTEMNHANCDNGEKT